MGVKVRSSKCCFLYRMQKVPTYKLLIFRVQVPLKALGWSNSLGIVRNECHYFWIPMTDMYKLKLIWIYLVCLFLLRTDQRFVLWRVLMNRWLSTVLRTTAKGRLWHSPSSRETCTNKRKHKWAQQGSEVRLFQHRPVGWKGNAFC